MCSTQVRSNELKNVKTAKLYKSLVYYLFEPRGSSLDFKVFTLKKL